MHYNITVNETWYSQMILDGTNLRTFKKMLESFVAKYNGYEPQFYNVVQSREHDTSRPDEYRTWVEFVFLSKEDINPISDIFRNDLEELVDNNFHLAKDFEMQFSCDLAEDEISFDW